MLLTPKHRIQQRATYQWRVWISGEDGAGIVMSKHGVRLLILFDTFSPSLTLKMSFFAYFQCLDKSKEFKWLIWRVTEVLVRGNEWINSLLFDLLYNFTVWGMVSSFWAVWHECLEVISALLGKNDNLTLVDTLLSFFGIIETSWKASISIDSVVHDFTTKIGVRNDTFIDMWTYCTLFWVQPMP